MFDFSREEQGSKAVTPKIVFKRPGSRESNGNFPGLRLVNNYNVLPNRNQPEKPQTADEQPQSTVLRQASTVVLRPNNYELQRLASRENMSAKTLAPLRGGEMQVGREVDKEIGNMYLQQRIRDLEGMMVDLKGNLERKLQKITDEQPGKFMANFKKLEDKEGQNYKESFQKQSMIQDQYSIMRETMRKQNEMTSQTLLELQRKIDDVTFQNHKLQKNQEQLQVYVKNGPLAIEQQGGNKKRSDPQEGQLALLREQFNQELKIRETAFEDLNRNYQDLQRKVYDQDKEFMSRMQKQKDAIIEETNIHKQQIKQLEGIKMDKLIGDNGYLKSIIDSVERRLQSEMDQRLKQEFESKAYFEQKMNLFKDEVRNDQKSIIEGEQKFVRQMNESIQSIHQIIKFTKEELDANLASTQTLFAESVKSFGQQIEVMRENLETKVMILERGYKEVNGRVNETRMQFQEHANIIQQQIEKQNDQLEQNEQQLYKQIDELQKETRLQVQEQDRQNSIWKDSFEKKNLAIFQEISTAMKGLKQDMQSDKKDTFSRLKDLREELNSFQQMNDKLIQNIKEHIDRNQDSVLFLISENDRKQSDLLTKAQAEIDKAVRELDDNIFLRGKEFTNQKVAALSDKMASDLTQQDERQLKELHSQIKKLQSQLEEEINTNEKNVQERIKDCRRLAEDLNDKTLKQLDQDKKDLYEFKLQQKDELRVLRKEQIDNLSRAIDQMRLDVDSKVDISQKKQEMALLLATRSIERLVEEQSNKQAEDLAAVKDQLINKFKQELEEVVLKKLMTEIQLEKNERILRESEIETSMHNIKNMILEALHQKVEAAKALARGIVAEEAAERAKNDEEILQFMKDGLETLEKTMRQLIRTQIEEAIYQLRQEIQELANKINELKEWVMKELKKLQDELKEWKEQQQVENYMRDMYLKLRDQELQDIIKNIEFEMVTTKKSIEDNLLMLIIEINARKEEITRVDNNIDNHEDRIVDHENRIVEQRHDFEILKKSVNSVNDTIKKSVEKQREDFEKNVEYLDNEVKENMNSIEGRVFIDNMMYKLQFETILNANSSNEDLVQEIKAKLTETIEQMNENFAQQEIFEEKTEKNFTVADKAIKSHSNYINDLDAKLYFEQLVGQLASQDLQSQQAMLFEQAQQNSQAIYEEIERAIGGLAQDNNEKMEELEKMANSTQDKVEQHQQQLEDHNEKIDNQSKQILLVETDLRQTEDSINLKIGEVVNSVNENINQFNGETQGFKDEINIKLNETNVKIDDIQTKQEQFNTQIDEINEKLETHNAKADEQANKHEDVKAQIEEMNLKNVEVNEKIDAFNAKTEEQAQKSEESEKRLAEALEKAESSDKRIEEISEKIEELKSKQEQDTQKLEEQVQKAEEHNQKFEENNQKFEEYNQKFEEHTQKIEEHSQKIDELNGKLDEQGQKQEELKEQQQKDQEESKLDEEEKDKQNGSMNDKLAELEEKLNKLQSEEMVQMKEELNTKLEEVSNKVDEINTKMEEFNTQTTEKVEDLGNDIHQQTERIDKLEEALQNKKGGDDEDNDQSKQDKQNNESFQKKLEEDIQQLKEQFEQLKTEDLEQIRNDLDTQVKKLEEQIEEIQNNNNNNKDQSNNASKEKGDLQEMQQELEAVKQEAQEAKQEVSEAKQEAQEAKQEVEEMKATVEELKSSVEEMKQAVEELKGQQEEMKQETEDAKAQVQEVKEGLEEMKELDTKIKEMEERLEQVESK